METIRNTRNTQHQKAVLQYLKDSNTALTADEIRAGITGKINKTTVYRMLERFVASGNVHFITGQDGKAYYAFCENCKEGHKGVFHNHLHFQCNNCGEVECLPEKVQVPNLDGYHIEETQFLIIGTCKKCNNS
ncbi:Fur family transcriptional regulator [Autumnicola musiva]|uniref:Transcriptional repressor n=1 Tax=Autumnicola musiva TaxID=3075589 RepID=A0ABU3DCK7_9FLAO|nr:transcriptional repressor [Zunongwangia sp. F117]MDT0678708.1 transcriptional repressor [Zunongwangia sp. F117]